MPIGNFGQAFAAEATAYDLAERIWQSGTTRALDDLEKLVILDHRLDVFPTVDFVSIDKGSDARRFFRTELERRTEKVPGYCADVSIGSVGIDSMQRVRDADEGDLRQVFRIIVIQATFEEPENRPSQSAQKRIQAARVIQLRAADEIGQVLRGWP